ncbi:MAG: hypothetical protein FGF50_09775, partial [Candidatus Brockarchaeota archaeon]|nr:hypothetical protein [Candidatus Brockarchaeota archaeon]
IAIFDNGEKTACGTEEFLVRVPQGAKKLQGIQIVTTEEKVPQYLRKIIENPDSPEVRTFIGYVSEDTVNSKYSNEIISFILKKAGVSEDQLNQELSKLGKSVDVKWFGENDKREIVDLLIRVKEGVREVTIGGRTFHEKEVIAIIEVKSTTDTVSEKNFLRIFGDAKDDLKKHVNLDKYKTAQYGVAVALAYDPVDMLSALKDPSAKPYPDRVGSYKNPYIEVFTRSEIEEFKGDG